MRSEVTKEQTNSNLYQVPSRSKFLCEVTSKYGTSHSIMMHDATYTFRGCDSTLCTCYSTLHAYTCTLNKEFPIKASCPEAYAYMYMYMHDHKVDYLW